MRKHVALIALTAGLVGAASAADTAPASLGFAESRLPFVVARAESNLSGAAEREMMIQTGDHIRAGDEQVRLQTTTGETLFVKKNSAAALAANGSVKLENGSLLAVLTKGSKMSLSLDDLKIAPAGDPINAANPPMVSMDMLSDKRVSIAAINQRFSVSRGDNTVGMISGNDAMILEKTEAGWSLPEEAATKPKQIAQADGKDDDKAKSDDTQDPNESKKRRRGGFWIFGAPLAVGAAVVGAGVGGFAIYNATTGGGGSSGGGGGGSDRPPSSPVFPKRAHR